jgi:hypothetical protein
MANNINFPQGVQQTINNAAMQAQAQEDAAAFAALLQAEQGVNRGQQSQGNNQLASLLRQGNQNNQGNQGQSALGKYFSNTFGGSANNDLSAYTPWNQGATANTYGTDPYSQQSLMLAQQDAGLSDSPWLGNFNSGNLSSGLDGIGNLFDGWGSSIGNFFSGIGDWFGSSVAPAVGDAASSAAPVVEEAAPAAAAAA